MSAPVRQGEAAGAAPDGPSPPGGPLPLGVIGRPHGVRGEVVFRPYNPGGVGLHELELPLAVELRGAGSPPQPLNLISARPFDDGALIAFEGIRDRDEVARLTHRELCVDREHLPALDEEEVYLHDLVGYAVVDQHGRDRGRVESSFWNGSQDVLTIREPGGGELLIPAVPEFLRQVHNDQRRLVIDDHE